MGEIISEIFDNYGLMGLGMFVVAVIALSVLIKNATNSASKLSWPRFKMRRAIDASLKDHLFFTNAHFKLRFDIPALKLIPDNPALEQMYIDLIYLTVEAFYYGCKSIVRIPELGTMSGAEWDTEIKYSIERMLKSMEHKAEDFGVPHSALKEYLTWTVKYTDLLRNYVTQMSGSAVYGESIIRTNTFLLIMNLLIITMVGDIERLARRSAAESDLTGLVYRGRKLEV